MPLDFDNQSLLSSLASGGAKPFHASTVDEARALMASVKNIIARGPSLCAAADEAIHAADREIRVRVLMPSDSPDGVIVYCHGGGWVTMSIDDYDTVGRLIAHESGCTVVLVEYRLAPEHRFPSALDDVWEVVRWADRNRQRLAPAGARWLMVAGDSAGGNLAAAVVLRARDERGPTIDKQILIYPVVQADTSRPGFLDPKNNALIAKEDMAWFWDQYVPDANARRHPYASPLLAENFEHLPETLVLVAENDVLREEGEEYAATLAASGVNVVLRRYEGQMHGFLTFPGVLPKAKLAILELAEFCRQGAEAFSGSELKVKT